MRVRTVRPEDSDDLPAAIRYLKQKAQRADVSLEKAKRTQNPMLIDSAMHAMRMLTAAAFDAVHEFEDARMPRLQALLGTNAPTDTTTPTTAASQNRAWIPPRLPSTSSASAPTCPAPNCGYEMHDNTRDQNNPHYKCKNPACAKRFVRQADGTLVQWVPQPSKVRGQ